MTLNQDIRASFVCYGFALILGVVAASPQIQTLHIAHADQSGLSNKLQTYLREGKISEAERELRAWQDLSLIQKETGCADLLSKPLCLKGLLLGDASQKASDLVPELVRRLRDHGWFLLESKNTHELMAKKETGRYRSCLMEIDDSGTETRLLMQLLEKGGS